MHGAQYPVRARLEREVEVLTHRLGLGHGSGHILSEVIGMGTGETHPSDPLHVAHPSQQLGEDRPPLAVEGEIATVGVDVLTQQSDLDHAVGGESLHLSHYVAGTA